MSLIKNSSGKQESNHTSISTKFVEVVNEAQDQLKSLLMVLDSIKIKPIKLSHEREKYLLTALENTDFPVMAISDTHDVSGTLFKRTISELPREFLTNLLEISIFLLS